MMLPDASAGAFRSGLAEPLSEMVEAYRLRDETSTAGESTPPLIATAFEQLFDVMQRTEAERATSNRSPGVDADTLTELGEYALELFDQSLHWANHLDLPGVFTVLQAYTIAMVSWIARQGGQVLTLEPVVDAFARHANNTRQPGELLALYQAMSEALQATATVIQQDLEKSNPGRPWRILHLNRAIVATRTHQPDLMEEAFGDLTDHLPEDAAGFFSQGMEQMELLDYPPHVREVMDRYYKIWGVDRSLH